MQETVQPKPFTWVAVCSDAYIGFMSKCGQKNRGTWERKFLGSLIAQACKGVVQMLKGKNNKGARPLQWAANWLEISLA